MHKKTLISNLYRFLILVVVSIAIEGCAVSGTGAEFTLEPAQEGVVTIYHYRSRALKASAFSYDVLSNGKPLMRMGNGGYFKEVVKPGKIEYRTKLYQDKGPINLEDLITNSYQKYELAYTLEAVGNSTIFLRWKPRVFGGPPSIEQVDEKDALPKLSGLRAFPPVKTTEDSSP